MIIFIIVSFLIILVIGLYYRRFYLKYTHARVEKDDLLEFPPENVSPAAMRYLMYADYDSDCLISAMVSASAKGPYGMIWQPNRFSIKLRNPSLFNSLSLDEKAALSLSRNNPVRGLSFESERNKFTDRADTRLMESLEKNYGHLLAPRKSYFRKGLIISVVLFTIFVIVQAPAKFIIDLLFGLVLSGTVLASQWLLETIQDGWDWYFGLRDFILTALGLILVIFLGYFHPLGVKLLFYIPIYLFTIMGYWFMPKYTEEGAKICRDILAYRKYLHEKSSDSYHQENEETLANQLALSVWSEATKPFESLLTKQKPPDNIEGIGREMWTGFRRI